MRRAESPDNATMPSVQTAEPFVVKRRGLGTTKTVLYLGTVLFALMVLLTVLCVVVQLIRGEPVRDPLEAIWLSFGGTPLIFAVGLPVLLAVGAVTTIEERRESDSDDVLLSIDAAGIHLGGEQRRMIAWPDVHGVCRVERHEVNAEGDEVWEPYLVVLVHDETSLARSSRTWGPSCRWPGTVEILGRPLPYDDLVAAVARYAPDVTVTDRGRALD